MQRLETVLVAVTFLQTIPNWCHLMHQKVKYSVWENSRMHWYDYHCLIYVLCKLDRCLQVSPLYNLRSRRRKDYSYTLNVGVWKLYKIIVIRKVWFIELINMYSIQNKSCRSGFNRFITSMGQCGYQQSKPW